MLKLRIELLIPNNFNHFSICPTCLAIDLTCSTLVPQHPPKTLRCEACFDLNPEMRRPNSSGLPSSRVSSESWDQKFNILWRLYQKKQGNFTIVNKKARQFTIVKKFSNCLNFSNISKIKKKNFGVFYLATYIFFLFSLNQDRVH